MVNLHLMNAKFYSECTLLGQVFMMRQMEIKPEVKYQHIMLMPTTLHFLIGLNDANDAISREVFLYYMPTPHRHVPRAYVSTDRRFRQILSSSVVF